MNHSDQFTLPQAASTHRRKFYCSPAIIVELDLETRAGNSVYGPICPDCSNQPDTGQGLDSFSSK
jgi:hypothetical protein